MNKQIADEITKAQIALHPVCEVCGKKKSDGGIFSTDVKTKAIRCEACIHKYGMITAIDSIRKAN